MRVNSKYGFTAGKLVADQTSNKSDKRQNSTSDWALRSSLILMAVVAIAAVNWVIFFSEDGVEDLFTSDNLPAVEQLPDTTGDAQAEIPNTVIPSFDIVRISRNGTGVLAGRAEPNSDVYVFAWDKQIGAAVADRNGEWVLLFDNPLPVGPTELSLKSQMPGAIDIYSSDVVIVAVPERDDERFLDDENSGVVAVLSPRAGNGPSRILQKPKKVNLDDLNKGLSLESLDYTDDGNSIISGYAEPGATVRVYLDNEYLGDVTGSEEGQWIMVMDQAIAGDDHVLRLDQILEGDDVEVRIEQPFNINTKIDQGLSKGEIIVHPGNSLWHISRRLYGSGFHYTLIFGANRELIRDPDLIYPGQKFALPSGGDVELSDTVQSN